MLICVGVQPAFAADPTGAPYTLVDPLPTAQTDDQMTPTISADANEIAFVSRDSYVSGDTDTSRDLYLRDLRSGTYRWITQPTAGDFVTGEASTPVLSPNGRWLAFTFFDRGDPAQRGTYLDDLITGSISVIDRGVNQSSLAGVGDDGTTLYVGGDGKSYVKRLTGAAVAFPASVTIDGTVYLTNTANAGEVALSGDGSTALFDLKAPNGHIKGAAYAIASGAWSIVTDPSTLAATPGADANATAISYSGRHVAFVSNDPNQPTAPGGASVYPLFLRDRQASTTRLVAAGPVSAGMGISRDGRYVGFAAPSGTLDPAHAVPVPTPRDPTDGGNSYLYVATIANGTVTRVGGRVANLPVFAIDALRFAFVSYGLLIPELPTNVNALYLNAPFIPADIAAPVVSSLAISPNPLRVKTSGVLTATANDTGSGVAAGEFFIGNDPGQGHAIPLALAGSMLTARIGSSLPAGFYRVSVRAVDNAGNWSTPSKITLVVYDPAAGPIRGSGEIHPGSRTSDTGDTLPRLARHAVATFAFGSNYPTLRSTRPNGAVHIVYHAGPLRIRTVGIRWLLVDAHTARFEADGRIDGTPGSFTLRVSATDNPGTRRDHVSFRLWAASSDPDADPPLYQASGNLTAGSLRIR